MVVTFPGGRVGGVVGEGWIRFLGIPYATPPSGPARSLPPAPPGHWAREKEPAGAIPGSPQLPSRLEGVMGHFPGVYSDDSLTLNIWTPVTAGAKAVLLWFHGGGWATGSANWSGYDGASLAAAEDIIVVTANSRLSALGYALLGDPESGQARSNLGFRDQIAALRWVHANIEAFGGDPSAIVVGGQSAGAQAAILLAASRETRPLVSGVLAQSPPMGWQHQERDEAAAVAAEILAQLGLPDGDWAAFDAIDSRDVVTAAAEVSRRRARAGVLMPPLRVMRDELVPWRDPTEALAELDDWHGAVMIGHTAEEARAFVQGNPALAGVTSNDVAGILSAQFGEHSEGDEHRPGASDAEPLDLLITELIRLGHTQPTHRALERRAAHGRRDYLYSFGWAEGPFGACHCVDLPFLFGPSQWAEAPMLQNASAGSLERVHQEFRSAVGRFVRAGDPGWTPAGPRGDAAHDLR